MMSYPIYMAISKYPKHANNYFLLYYTYGEWSTHTILKLKSHNNYNCVYNMMTIDLYNYWHAILNKQFEI